MTDSRLADARRLFSPEGTYLNTATYGLPPRTAFDAMAHAADEWRHGRTGFDGWDRSVAAARASFARLAGVGAADVAIGSAVSLFAGLIASALPAGARVLCAEGDFTSVLFPFLAQERRGVVVELVPLERVPEALGPGHDVVAVSAVQSATGRVADLDALTAAAAAHGARTFVDTTQALGWLPLDCARFDYTACAAYKWLLSPRGTAFFTIAPERRDELIPHAAGWYAGEDVPASYYGAPLRLAADARRFDLSPAWLNWVGRAPALALLEASGSTRSTPTTSRWPRGCGPASGCRDRHRRSYRQRAAGRCAGERLQARRHDGRGARRRAALLLPPLHDASADVDRALELLAAL